ncbi:MULTISPECIES: hypothetical protein [unclassified Coleofasciculus]|uniref:hypothetical protein n=1 Tax=unclassified Coleofasciculus TaxID=2692782 RepID=UPI001882EA80|nr:MULTISPECIES: hypothetical protein [unclassified Coleofasciculus]MBE9129270.1 hypothetical protein [Coleofasciculus sp. LEGE 07081]MBE9147424.1 hypothetical protein [Coleofasciculus sp. LEGE 07092]
MKRAFFQKEQVNSSDYLSRTPSYYLQRVEPHVLSSFNSEQLEAIVSVLDQAIPKPSPKIVDLRFVVDLVLSRFYIVLFVGKDRRKKQRRYESNGMAKIGNVVAAVILLIAINLMLSALLMLFGYLLKSALGINLFPGHISETIQKVL